ncbi:MAG: 30S ribosomal protein S16 [Nevskiaceae bacterium]|nr:MAG: 30S ribosomal protein S16 [Nevskiaceae bacterium]TBR71873.1 MAG: 30S ribosomal protein S16 [Nevskiaceae bacterium]
MVKIRLARTGAKKRPFYHIVATDRRSPRDGRFIERLGYFNPGARGGEQRLVLDTERLQAWQVKGAQVSSRVAFLAKQGGAAVEATAQA